MLYFTGSLYPASNLCILDVRASVTKPQSNLSYCAADLRSIGTKCGEESQSRPQALTNLINTLILHQQRATSCQIVISLPTKVCHFFSSNGRNHPWSRSSTSQSLVSISSVLRPAHPQVKRHPLFYFNRLLPLLGAHSLSCKTESCRLTACRWRARSNYLRGAMFWGYDARSACSMRTRDVEGCGHRVGD